ncbi:MAG: hypothetical protein JST11_22770 [Acidobacteria bacterium]|nr:hypothetical protein [Acidobacteriota bacterium]
MRPERLRTFGAAAFLFALNAYITLPLFHTAYTRQMGSIEAAYIGLARYIAAHFSQLDWFPLWYCGIPYPDTYPPLLHWICGAVVALAGASPGLAHHVVTATVYALGAVTLFWMVLRLSGNRGAAFAAGLGYSLISPSCLLVKEVRFDAGGAWAARRLHTLVVYGEGPHLTSMCLLPLAIGMLHLALEKRRPLYWFGAALAVAAVPLSNWLGAVALAFGAVALLLAYATDVRRWILAGLVGAWAYAIALPWMSPATIAVIQANAPRVARNFESTVEQKLFLAATLGGLLAGAWLLRRLRVEAAARFALLFSFLTGAAALGKYWFGLSLVPQPERYHLEMDMAFWVAAALLLCPLLKGPRARALALSAAAVATVALAVHQHRVAREWEKPIDIASTIEYQSARWLDTHMAGARVFAPGTIGFWLNAFSDNPQITGGFDNGILNPMVPHVIYQVYAGEKQQVMVDLMQAYGVDAVIGSGKDSREVYHPIAHPEKFAGMKELWRNGGDAVYEIPRRSRSLAHTIPPSAVVETAPPAYDTASIRPYLAALEDPAMPPAEFRWLAPDRAAIAADGLRPEQLFSVQVTFDKGWHATADGRPVPLRADKLGQMVAAPRCTGPCRVELRYDGGSEHRFASLACLLALVAGPLWWGIDYAKRIRVQRG